MRLPLRIPTGQETIFQLPMSEPKTYRTAEAAKLSLLFEICIETLTDVAADQLAAIPEEERSAALAAGEVVSIGRVLGSYVAGLYAARDGDWLLALRRIRDAIAKGFAPHQAVQVVELIHRGIAAELQVPGFAKVLFLPSSLGLVRWVEAKLNYPCAADHGVETDIVVVEERPLVEIREVFTRPFLEEVPHGAEQDEYVDRLLSTATAAEQPPSLRAEALVTMATLALAAHETPAAVSLVAMAVRVAPDHELTGIAASFLWVAINAAGREAKFISAKDCSAWPDVVAVLHGALAYESRHSASQITEAQHRGEASQ